MAKRVKVRSQGCAFCHDYDTCTVTVHDEYAVEVKATDYVARHGMIMACQVKYQPICRDCKLFEEGACRAYLFADETEYLEMTRCSKKVLS